MHGTGRLDGTTEPIFPSFSIPRVYKCLYVYTYIYHEETQTLQLSNADRIFFCLWQPENEESTPRSVSSVPRVYPHTRKLAYNFTYEIVLVLFMLLYTWENVYIFPFFFLNYREDFGFFFYEFGERSFLHLNLFIIYKYACGEMRWTDVFF